MHHMLFREGQTWRRPSHHTVKLSIFALPAIHSAPPLSATSQTSFILALENSAPPRIWRRPLRPIVKLLVLSLLAIPLLLMTSLLLFLRSSIDRHDGGSGGGHRVPPLPSTIVYLRAIPFVPPLSSTLQPPFPPALRNWARRRIWRSPSSCSLMLR